MKKRRITFEIAEEDHKFLIRQAEQDGVSVQNIIDTLMTLGWERVSNLNNATGEPLWESYVEEHNKMHKNL